jgi:hypothetical protein
MVRAFGAFIALGLVAGCITDGNYQAGGLGDPPARPWFGPYGGTYGSYERPFGYAPNPFRPRYDYDQPFRPSRHVVCDPDDRVCYKNGHPDPSETRDFFGKKAARRID